MNRFEYRRLYPFKWFVLQNFPFIEEDFDAITNYQLYCKIVEYLNEVIKNTNKTGEELETLVNSFNALTQYVDNYFDNLDIQTEINNKLDEMAEGGELTELLTAYLQLKCIYGYNNIEEMKVASNLVDGSFVKTYGKNNLNDGRGAFYKIRNIENTDVVDNENIIALNNPNLVAEKIIESQNMSFAQLVDTEIYAQLKPRNVDVSQHGCQSFAIGNGVIVSCWTAYPSIDDSGNHGILVSQNFVTGEQLAIKTNQSIGHGNDITYCSKDGYFYIPCGGGYNPLQKIKVVDNMLNTIREIDTTGTPLEDVYGLAYNELEDVFYCFARNYELFKVSYNFTNILKTANTISSNIGGQGIFFDGKYVSVIVNIENPIYSYANYNKIDVYDTNLEYVCSQKIMEINEFTDGCYYNNDLYLLKWYNHVPLIYKGTQFLNDKNYKFIDNNLIMGNAFPTYGAFYDIYINKNYDGFLVDGSQEKPFNDILCGLTNIKNMFSRINVYIQGDFSAVGINIQKCDKTLSFIGTVSGTKTKIKGFGIKNCTDVSINNFEIVGASDMSNNQIAIYNTNSISLENIKFNGTTNESTTIYAINSNVIIKENIEFAKDVTSNLFNIFTGSTIHFQNAPTITGNITHAPIMWGEKYNLFYRPPLNFLTQSGDFTTIIIGGINSINIANITKEGNYRVEGGTAVLDAPSGLQASNSGVKFIVKNIGGVIYYLLSNYNGATVYIGTKTTSNVVSWKQLFP